jgi:hypothetical protein
MKKNLFFVLGLASLLCISLFVFTPKETGNPTLSPTSLKSEIGQPTPISSLPQETLQENQPLQGSDKKGCNKKDPTCCSGKKSPAPTQISTDEREKIEKSNHLDALEDPDDVVSSDPHAKRWSLQQRFGEAAAIEFEKTKDPALGYVPSERLLVAMETTRRFQAQSQSQNAHLRGVLSNVRWLERGPSNIGGRTRAIQVDLNDKTGNTIFAGGVAGGLFKVTDVTGTAKWERINDWHHTRP